MNTQLDTPKPNHCVKTFNALHEARTFLVLLEVTSFLGDFSVHDIIDSFSICIQKRVARKCIHWSNKRQLIFYSFFKHFLSKSFENEKSFLAA